MGDVLGGEDLLMSALQWANSPNYNLEWLFNDLPFFVDAMQNRDGYVAVSHFLEKGNGLFKLQLGPNHPKTQFILAMRLTQSFRNDERAMFDKLVSELRLTVELQSDEENSDSTTLTAGGLLATIAQKWKPIPSLQSVALYAMAAEISGSASDVEADVELRKERPDYRALAVDELRACSESGKLRTTRAQFWLKNSSDLNVLRDREDFRQLVANIETANLIEKSTRQAWELATSGEPQKAKETLQEFSNDYPDLANLGTVQYLIARTYAVCYEAVIKEQPVSSAKEYLDACRASLEACSRVGFFKSQDNRKTLATDQNFDLVRQELELVKTLSDP
jgi:hypothetical protein